MMRLVFLSVFLLLIVGCKTTKQTTTSVSSKSLTTKHVLEQYDAHLFKSRTLNARLKTTVVDGGRRISMTIKLRMEQDKVIWMSASYLGITMAKLMMTPDKVRYYEKLHQTYFDGDYKLIEQKLGFSADFKALQNILLGQAVNGLSAKNNKGKPLGHEYFIEYDPKNNHYILQYIIDVSHYKLTKQKVITENQSSFSVDYSAYFMVDGESIPEMIKVATYDAKTQQSTDLATLKFSDVKLNEPLSFPFEIPSGYAPVKF